MPPNGRGQNEPGHERLSFASMRRSSAAGEKRAVPFAEGKEKDEARSERTRGKDEAQSTRIGVEEDLERLERLASLGTLSAGLAHEIKNALVAITTFINLLLEKNQDAQLAEIVQRELSRIDAIASQMLNLANPSTPQDRKSVV